MKGNDPMTDTVDLLEALTGDPVTRTRAAATIAAAAEQLAAAARGVRDPGIRELLRKGERPAAIGRLAGLASSQLTRFDAAVKAPRGATVRAEAQTVIDALSTLYALYEGLGEAE